MNKKIKTTDTNLEVRTSTSMIVKVGDFKFIQEKECPWVTIYLEGSQIEDDTYIEEITTDEPAGIVDFSKLKIFALNWVFNNVEIVSNI